MKTRIFAAPAVKGLNLLIMDDLIASNLIVRCADYAHFQYGLLFEMK